MLGDLGLGSEGQVGRVEQILGGQLAVDGERRAQPLGQVLEVGAGGSPAIRGDHHVEDQDVDLQVRGPGTRGLGHQRGLVLE